MSAADLLDRPSFPWSLFQREVQSRPTRHRSRPMRRPAVKWMLLACSCVALLSSGYLAWVSLTSGSVAGCSGSLFNCDHVLHSRWATILSVPVSIPAMLTHATLIGLLMVGRLRMPMERYRWSAISFAAITAGTAAVWFTGLQLFWLEHLCPYCLVAHAAGGIAAAIVLTHRPFGIAPLLKIVPAAIASVAVLIAIQLATPAPDTFETINYPTVPSAIQPTPEAAIDEDASLFEAPISSTRASQPSLIPQSIVMAMFSPGMLVHAQVDQIAAGASGSEPKQRHTAKILGGIELDTSQWPIIGRPDAELVFVEMFDYTCPHCQRTHAALTEAQKRYGDSLAIVCLPVPLDRACNPTVKRTGAAHVEACDLARLAISVWLVDSKAFNSFHDYLFEAKPRYADALQHASELVDAAKLRQTMAGSTPGAYITKHVSLYERAGGGVIPKLMFPRSTTVGEVASSERLVQLITQHLGRIPAKP
ncbi:Vitamin K epoxide reductase family protein [Novipirellula galeiformis]|uniref:Vitamin K epoxide reductase family protein n=2 Tax=Novipirellula galeiformis TaxID=2528004 RepID=A0A5C6BZS8_9BACT|nr:Vitamin K epoxide reductase family protein [Novipirellula galeiformis]